MLSRTPCSNGSPPVSIDAWEGSVSGACADAWSNTTPSAASATIAGMLFSLRPYTGSRSARKVSIEIRNDWPAMDRRRRAARQPGQTAPAAAAMATVSML